MIKWLIRLFAQLVCPRCCIIMGGSSTNVEAPPPRDYYKEGRDTLQAQVDLAPQIYASEALYRPQYADLDLQILRNTLLGKSGTGSDGYIGLAEAVQPGFNRLLAASNNAQRQADISDVETLGPRAREAFRQANPDLARVQDTLVDRATAAGQSEIGAELQRQAMEELRMGGRLSADDARTASQSARAAYNARGIVRSDAGAFAEALNLSRFSEGRKAERRQFAMGVEGQGMQRDQLNANLLGATADTIARTSLDPFQTILGRPAMAAGLGQSGMSQAGFSLSSGPQIFNPYDPAAQSLYASNQQNTMDARTANAANRGAMQSAGIGAAGTIIGALLMCWIARAAYGPADFRWYEFRHWMHTRAPVWLFDLYYTHGERAGAWLERHAWAKAPVRTVMNLILKHA